MKRDKRKLFRCVAFCGGIGTGKSTLGRLIAERLARLGFTPLLFDFDQLRRISFLEVGRNRKMQRVLQSVGLSTLSEPTEISRFILMAPERMIQVGDVIAEEIVEELESRYFRDPKTIVLLEWPGPLPDVLRDRIVTDLVSLSCPVKEQIRRLSSGDLALQEIRKRIRMQGKVVHLRRRIQTTIPELLVDTSNLDVDDTAQKTIEWIFKNQNNSEKTRANINSHLEGVVSNKTSHNEQRKVLGEGRT